MAQAFDLVTLTDFKNFINKPLTEITYDTNIEALITQASREIESYVRRKLRARNYVEYRDGSGTGSLFTKQYPIISVASLYDDTERAWASTTLKAATDYAILEQEGSVDLLPGALSGTVYVESTQNIKIDYYAGFDHFEVTEDTNDKIDFKEDNDAALVATLTAGIYTANELVTEIDTQLTAAGVKDYTVVWNRVSGLFTFTPDSGTLQFLWDSGDNAHQACADLLGFNLDDTTGASALSSDFGVLGIPQDLSLACIYLALRHYNEGGLGGNRFDLAKKDTTIGGNKGTTEFVGGEMPPSVKSILRYYKRSIV